jgi:hypothetical protein
MSHILGYDASTQRYRPERLQRPRWPGKSYKVDTSNAQALLVTPNGKGVGWLVAQHRVAMGWKCVEWVTIFFTNSEDWEKSNLLFGLRKVSKGVGKEQVLRMHVSLVYAYY